MTAMNPFDLAVLIIVVLSTFMGGMRGIISQVGSLAAWIVGLIASARYYGVFAPMVPVAEQWKIPCAAFVAFVVAYIAVSVLTRFVKRTVSLVGFKEFDRQVGALAGLFKGVVLCVAITFFCALATDKTREIVDSSKSGSFFIGVIANVQSAFPDSELKTKFVEAASSLEHAEERGTVSDEADSLKNYLTTHVFTRTAAEVVEEADAEEEAAEKGATPDEKSTSLFQRFVDDARNLNKKVEAQIFRTTPNVATDESTEASSATNQYGTYSRQNYDDSNYSASTAPLANSTGEESSDETGFQKFWNSLGSRIVAPSSSVATSQTQSAQTTNSSPTYDASARETAAESVPTVEYGAYRARTSDSGSRLRSYRYQTVGPANY